MVVRCETGDAGTRSHRKEPGLEESRYHRMHRHAEVTGDVGLRGGGGWVWVEQCRETT